MVALYRSHRPSGSDCPGDQTDDAKDLRLSERPGEHHVRARLGCTCLSIRAEGGVVVRVGQHPHVVAAQLHREGAKSVGQRGSDASLSIPFVNRQLVQKHLGSLVGMRQLDAAHEPNWPPIQVCDEEMVRGVGKEPLNRVQARRAVEQVRRLHDEIFFAWTEMPDFYVQAARLMPIACSRLLSESNAYCTISLSVCPYSVTYRGSGGSSVPEIRGRHSTRVRWMIGANRCGSLRTASCRSLIPKLTCRDSSRAMAVNPR